MTKFIEVYGLLIVTTLLFLTTFLYTVATIWMAKVNALGYKLHTQPLLSFQPVNASADSWNSFEVEQEIINIGLSYVRIESAVLHWWPYMVKEQQRTVRGKIVLPHYLPPGARLKLRFEITNNLIKHLPQAHLNSLGEIVTGHLAYKYRGLDDTVIETVESLPS